jgi:multiple sugar transport system ATP-binding protein
LTAGADGQPVGYGVRPEHLSVTATDRGVPAEVVVIEPTGAETELIVQAGDTQITLVTHGRTSVQPGERIGLAIEPGAAHLFDRTTGARLSA